MADFGATSPRGRAPGERRVPTDAQWWQNAGATLTPFGGLPTSRPGAAEFAITQTEGPSYVGDLTPP
jgi:hypothetical protein